MEPCREGDFELQIANCKLQIERRLDLQRTDIFIFCPPAFAVVRFSRMKDFAY
jgi:hypothetical protein